MAMKSAEPLTSRRIDESPAEDSVLFLPIPIGSLLALDTTRRPWHGREAFWADRRFALNAGSKAAVANPSQCGFHVTQQAGLAVHVSHRQISFRRILNLIHLVRALLDGDAVPLAQYPNQFGRFSFQDLLEPAISVCAIFMAIPSPVWADYGRPTILAQLRCTVNLPIKPL